MRVRSGISNVTMGAIFLFFAFFAAIFWLAATNLSVTGGAPPSGATGLFIVGFFLVVGLYLFFKSGRKR